MQENSERRSNQARTDVTRAALIKAARKLFIEKGYRDTGTPEIVATAKVTRGALYHHFADKLALFEAVVLAEAEKVARDINKQSTVAAGALEALVEGANAYFQSMKVKGRSRLLLVEAPSVLSPEKLEDIDQATGAGELQLGLRQAIPDSEMDIAILTQLLSAMFDKAALLISQGGDEESYKKTISLLLSKLL